jgi:hypothetical protein
MKQLHDLQEQIEQTFVEYKTFENLRQHETGAIPKRSAVRLQFYNIILEYNRYMGIFEFYSSAVL